MNISLREMTMSKANLASAASGPMYAPWMGQSVVLQVEAGDMRVPLRGILVSEAQDTLRVRVGEGWDVDIYKSMVFAVEEDHWADVVT